jgi:hypothetical protein
VPAMSFDMAVDPLHLRAPELAISVGFTRPFCHVGAFLMAVSCVGAGAGTRAVAGCASRCILVEGQYMHEARDFPFARLTSSVCSRQ